MRSIDPKYHVDGDEIVQTSNGVPIPREEPLMLFRGRDHLALPLLRKYRELCVADGCTDYHLAGVDDRIAAFERFARECPERMKQPGCSLGK